MKSWCNLFKLAISDTYDEGVFKCSLVDIKKVTSLGSNALHFAATNKENQTIFMYLLEHADFMAYASNEYGEIPLHWACKEGTAGMVLAMVSRCPKLTHSVDADGNSPLHWAAEYGRKEIIRTLLKYNADLTAKNVDGQSPMDIAIENEEMESAELLK